MNQVAFLRFISLLLLNKKQLFINAFLVSVVSLTVAFLLPKWYNATTLFTPPQADASSGLSSLMGALPMNFGFSETTNTERFVTLLYSRTLMDALIDTFELRSDFDFDFRFQLRTYLRESIVSNEIFDDGSMLINVIFPDDSVKPALMANFLFKKIDEMYKKIKTRDAHFQRIFLENQYNLLVYELSALEDSLALFQQVNTIIDPVEQAKGSISLIAQFEMEKIQTEVELKLLEKNYNPSAPELQILIDKKTILQKQISNMVDKGSSETFFQSLKDVPGLSLTYFRLMRAIEIKQKIMEFLVPQLEKTKLDEIKDTPSLLVIDEAIPAEYKFKPKRALIAFISVLIAFLLHVASLLFGDFLKIKKETDKEFSQEMALVLSQIKRKK
jgi:capsule polysaccharide export protein KpsE/RkpR